MNICLCFTPHPAAVLGIAKLALSPDESLELTTIWYATGSSQRLGTIYTIGQRGYQCYWIV